MAINVSVQHNGGCLPDVILSTQGYYQRGTRFQRELWKADGCGEVSPRIVSVRSNTEENSGGRLVLRQKRCLDGTEPESVLPETASSRGGSASRDSSGSLASGEKISPRIVFCTIEYWGDPW